MAMGVAELKAEVAAAAGGRLLGGGGVGGVGGPGAGGGGFGRGALAEMPEIHQVRTEKRERRVRARARLGFFFCVLSFFISRPSPSPPFPI